MAVELEQVFDPRGGQWSNGRYVPSLVAAIGDVLERHMISTGFLTAEQGRIATQLESTDAMNRSKLGPFCPCGSQPGLVKGSGSPTCVYCGWLKCS